MYIDILTSGGLVVEAALLGFWPCLRALWPLRTSPAVCLHTQFLWWLIAVSCFHHCFEKKLKIIIEVLPPQIWMHWYCQLCVLVCPDLTSSCQCTHITSHESLQHILLFPEYLEHISSRVETMWFNYSEELNMTRHMNLICAMCKITFILSADSAEVEAPRAPPPTQINKMKWDILPMIWLLHNFVLN